MEEGALSQTRCLTVPLGVIGLDGLASAHKLVSEAGQ